MLTLLLAPFFAAVITVLASGKDQVATQRLATVLSLVIAGLGVWLLAAGQTPANDIAYAWFTLPGTEATVTFALSQGPSGLGLWLAQLATVLTPVALVGGFAAAGSRIREYATALFVAEGCLIGLFLAADLALFYLFFEAMLIPMVAIIALLGDGDRRAASLRFFLYTMVGSVPFLVAIWTLAAQVGTLELAALPAAIAGLDASTRMACFVAVALAFAVKTPLVPLHGWQAPVYASAPASAVVILGGAMAKAGTYGFLAILIPLFPAEAAASAGVFIALGIISVWWGALLALAERDLKRILAYSSLSHLGLVVVGLFSFHADAAAGAVVQMLAHGLAVAALFLTVGALERQRGQRGLDDFGGVVKTAPLLVVLLVGGALVSVALPGTLSFIGEFLLLIGIWQGLAESGSAVAATVVTAVAAASVILGVLYTLRLVQRVAYGTPTTSDEGVETITEMRSFEALPVAVVVLVSIVFGLAGGSISGTAGAGAASLVEPAATVQASTPVTPTEEVADVR